MTDPGLQPERTALAWSRTALAFAAVGALLLRAGFLGADVAGVVGAVAAAGGALAVSLVARRRRRELIAGDRSSSLLVGAAVANRARLVAGLAAVVALAVIGSILRQVGA